VTFRARIVNAAYAARSEWRRPTIPTAANPPDGGWTPLYRGDVYQLFLNNHSDLTFGDGHPGTKYVIVARDIESHEVQVPVFIAGTFSNTTPWHREVATRDDWVILPRAGRGGPKFCKDREVLVDCTKAPTLLRGRFQKRGRGNPHKDNVAGFMDILGEAHRVGMGLVPIDDAVSGESTFEA
jgi:hypothetical protein